MIYFENLHLEKPTHRPDNICSIHARIHHFNFQGAGGICPSLRALSLIPTEPKTRWNGSLNLCVRFFLRLHKLQHMLPTLLQIHRNIFDIRQNLVLQLLREHPQGLGLHHPLHPPILPLRRDISSAENTHMRVYEEERSNLAMAGFCVVDELERLSAVKEGVGKGDQTSFAAFNAAEKLHASSGFVDSEEILETVPGIAIRVPAVVG